MLLNFFLAGEVQPVNDLVATWKPLSLILDFRERKVEIKDEIKDLNWEINRMKKIFLSILLILSKRAELLRNFEFWTPKTYNQ